MAVDKLVDSTQLDADLTSIANAIRTKGGTSADLAFPSEFVSAIAAIPTGGGGGGSVQSGTFTLASDTTIPAAGTTIDIGLSSAPDVLIVWMDVDSFHALGSWSNNRWYMFALYKYSATFPPMRISNTTSVAGVFSNLDYVRVVNSNVATCSADSSGYGLTSGGIVGNNASNTKINSNGTVTLSSTAAGNQIMFAGKYHYVAITGAVFPVY